MRFLADENFNRRIVRGIRREDPAIEIVRIQDTEVFRADDPSILEYAADYGLILMTHDIGTMPKFAYERVSEGKPMPGVVAIPKLLAIGIAVEEFVLLVNIASHEDFANQVVYLPTFGGQ
jgi:hypothetical protein